MDAESPSESARQVARLSLAFEDMAADIRRGAQAGGLTLSEVRLLDGVLRGISEARTLSRCLRLDEGHVSRMVKRLRTAGLLVGRRQRGDGRRVTLSLTGEGALRLGQAIEGAACAAEATLGDELSGAGSVVGMALETMLDRMPPSDEIRLTPLQPGDPGWVVSQHGLLYARDEGFDSSFEATVARVVSDFMLTRDPSRESAWIARAGTERIGCIFCTGARDDGPTTAQLRLFLVRPEWRRRGWATGCWRPAGTLPRRRDTRNCCCTPMPNTARQCAFTRPAALPASGIAMSRPMAGS